MLKFLKHHKEDNLYNSPNNYDLIHLIHLTINQLSRDCLNNPHLHLIVIDLRKNLALPNRTKCTKKQVQIQG